MLLKADPQPLSQTSTPRLPPAMRLTINALLADVITPVLASQVMIKLVHIPPALAMGCA